MFFFLPLGHKRSLFIRLVRASGVWANNFSPRSLRRLPETFIGPLFSKATGTGNVQRPDYYTDPGRSNLANEGHKKRTSCLGGEKKIVNHFNSATAGGICTHHYSQSLPSAVFLRSHTSVYFPPPSRFEFPVRRWHFPTEVSRGCTEKTFITCIDFFFV